MAIDQSFLFNNSKQIAEQYSALETEILELLNKMHLGISSKKELSDWVKIALNNKKQFKKEVAQILKKYNIQLKPTLIDAINKNIDETLRLADANVGAIQKLNPNWTPPKVPTDRIQFLSNLSPQVKDTLKLMSKDISKMNSQILKGMDSWYVRSVQNVSAEIQSGVKTYRQAIQNTMTKWADKGIPSITTKNGRVINPRTYVETVTRATMKQDYIQNTTQRYKEYGLDLVSSDILGDSSQICEDDQGVVFSENGSNPNYRALSSANDGFLTHINCRHTLSPYVEGVSVKAQKIPESEIKKTRQLRLQSRYNERMIRKYKLRQVGDPSNKNASLLNKWQKKQVKLYKENPQIRRDYFREKIFDLHKTNALTAHTPIKPINKTK